MANGRPFARPSSRWPRLISIPAGRRRPTFLFFAMAAMLAPMAVRADGLERVRQAKRLQYGSDMEGGGPYAYIDQKAPGGMSGFEVELMRRLGRDLGVEPVFSQGQWDELLQILDLGRIDAVVNGYEWTEARGRQYLATRPYYVYQLQLMVRRGSPIRSWSDLKSPRPGGGPWTVGVLSASAGDTFAVEQGGPTDSRPGTRSA